MPELPEVEVTRLGFADRIRGARLHALALGKPLRWPLGVDAQQLAGRTVRGVRRRAKYLLIDLDDGSFILVHLGMSGSLRLLDAPTAPGPHDHADLHTSAGTLRLHDPRRFGAVVHCAGEADPFARKLLGHLGPEPLGDDFDPRAFFDALRRRRTAIKPALMAGDLVVGVGNIYASEALFLAGIRPTTPAHRLSRARSDRLHAAVRAVLARAVERGGSSLRDFVGVDGAAGHFQLEAAVYGREGLPCPRCGTPVRSLRQAQRSTFFCPRCQR